MPITLTEGSRIKVWGRILTGFHGLDPIYDLGRGKPAKIERVNSLGEGYLSIKMDDGRKGFVMVDQVGLPRSKRPKFSYGRKHGKKKESETSWRDI